MARTFSLNTKAVLQSQWNEIQKELKTMMNDVAIETLDEIAQDVLEEIHGGNRYNRDTGNLDESIMAVVATNRDEDGKHISPRRIHSWYILKNSEADRPYIVRGDKRIYANRGSAKTLNLTSGAAIRGKDETKRFFEDILSNESGYTEPYTMMVGTDLFYAYYLAAQGFMDGLLHYAQKIEQHNAKYKDMIMRNMRKGKFKAKMKNVKVT